MSVIRTLITTALALGTAGLAQAQATVKADGQWRAAFGLGASLSSGNSQSSNLSMSGDAVSRLSIRVGETFLPVESTISSFFRPRMVRNPSLSSAPKSPVCSQPY